LMWFLIATEVAKLSLKLKLASVLFWRPTDSFDVHVMCGK